MEGCDVEIISQILRVARPQVKKILKGESNKYEITKSLLNLLHNIVVVGSLPVSKTQRAYFDSNAELVLQLLSSSKSLTWKKSVFETNTPIVLNIAASCPTVAGW